VGDTRDERIERALEESTSLLSGTDPKQQLATPVHRIAEVIGSFADELCEGVGFDGPTTPWALRCIIRKTQESLETILHLAEEGTAYYATPLLRPMCEELIFARYLQILSEEDARRYLDLKTILEILQGMKAQIDFFPKAQEKVLPSHIYEEVRERSGTSHPTEPPDLDRRISLLKGELRDLGRKLGWDSSHYPSVKFMAEETDSLSEYEFFYHAASGSVHANTHHLGRMVWGDPEANRYSISNRNFNQYYYRFVLFYGAWLAMQITDEVRKSFPDEWPESDEDAYAVLAAFLLVPNLMHRFPPLVTEEELT
jgi:Family of unknown function (DUF5677)